MNNMKAAAVRLLTIFFICFLAPFSAYGGEYPALDDISALKTVFDVRSDNVKSTAMHLDLILQTFRDKNLRQVSSIPRFAIVFSGPSVKLISTNREGFSAEDKELLGQINETIDALAKENIKLEVCMIAARVFGIDPSSILPKIQQVPNGFISLIGFQEKGYALIPVY